MAGRVLVTGGAGFIGSFLVDALLERGRPVRVLDNLEDQVHKGEKPAYLSPEAEFVRGDIRSIEDLTAALADVETVIHCAAAVGVAQSQYEIKRYVDVNVGGTANLLDAVVNGKLPVRKILMPTSMTSYGEGAYRCAEHGRVRPGLRDPKRLAAKDYEIHCPVCDAVVTPVPILETDERRSSTIYSLSKNMQEDMLLNIGQTYGIPVTALRLFNAYGPRQSLSNPYTGVTAIFASRIKNGKAPAVFEDGTQSRDFVSVHDVVRAFLLAMEPGVGDGEVFNIGGGTPISILEVGRAVARALGKDIEPVLTGEARKNDVRHCYADASKAGKLLGWEPAIGFDDGLKELVGWAEGEKADDYFAAAAEELRKKNLYV